MNLDKLTVEQIERGPIPLDELLKDSVFYPASRTDGRPIELCNTAWRNLGVNSFVYCDFDESVDEFLADSRTMCGYHPIAHRHLDPSEYIPLNWALEMAPEGGKRGGYFDSFLGGKGPEKYACWVVFERSIHKGEDHGPKRLSVLYVCGEGLATFQQLYCRRGIRPKMLCFIQCWGFAGNWTDFTACWGPFHYTLNKYRLSIPEWLCIGDCCGIHGVLRLTNLSEANIKLTSYHTAQFIRSHWGDDITTLSNSLYDSALLIRRNSRVFLAANVSYHMGYVVYDITDSTMSIEELRQWLRLDAPEKHRAR